MESLNFRGFDYVICAFIGTSSGFSCECLISGAWIKFHGPLLLLIK